MGKQSFVHGAVILATASIISRFLGVAYIIALPRIIHDDGMGLLQMVRPVYNIAVILSVAGLPVALSKLVAEQLARNHIHGALQVFRWALLVMSLLGALCSTMLCVGAGWIAQKVVRDPLAYFPLVAIAPSVFLLAVVAAVRGFFQGMQYMTPTAVSQVVEQIARVTSMVALALLLISRGVQYGAAGAAFSSVVGGLGSLVVLIGYYIFWRRSQRVNPPPAKVSIPVPEGKEILHRLFSLSLPIVLGAILWPVMQMIDTGLVPVRLQQAGYTATGIREALGYLGMALSLMHFPNVITWALAVTLVPAVAEAQALLAHRYLQRRVSEALRITVYLGLPASAGLYLLAPEASHLLFGYPQVGEPLRILAAGTLAVGLFQTCSGILQGLGEVAIPVNNLVVGVILKFILNHWLTAIPGVGIKGAALGTTIGFGVACLLNLAAVKRKTKVCLGALAFLLKPAVATVIMALAVSVSYDGLYALARMLPWPAFRDQGRGFFACNGVATTGSVLTGICVYALGLLGTGALCRRDIELLPCIGKGLAQWLGERGLI